MSLLIAQLEQAFGNLVQEAHKDASVLVQFAAGDWAKLKAAYLAEKDEILARMNGSQAPSEVVEHPDIVLNSTSKAPDGTVVVDPAPLQSVIDANNAPANDPQFDAQPAPTETTPADHPTQD